MDLDGWRLAQPIDVCEWVCYDMAVMLRELPVIRERGSCCELPVTVDQEWVTSQADLLKALGDPTRLTMMAALRKAAAPVCICDFTAALNLSQPTISHHMAKLREAGLVEAEKRGIWVYYRLHPNLPANAAGILDALLT
jgi:ArsR family transcriptional regulator, arsenate/arsenite/antimonite-responsive transcriptional repressor